jgi:hypothetical protein
VDAEFGLAGIEKAGNETLAPILFLLDRGIDDRLGDAAFSSETRAASLAVLSTMRTLPSAEIARVTFTRCSLISVSPDGRSSLVGRMAGTGCRADAES